jgi:hypothetical protein
MVACLVGPGGAGPRGKAGGATFTPGLCCEVTGPGVCLVILGCFGGGAGFNFGLRAGLGLPVLENLGLEGFSVKRAGGGSSTEQVESVEIDGKFKTRLH